MSEPQSEIQLLAEAVLALAKAVRDAPPPVINVTVQAPESPAHPVTVTVIEREREDGPPPVVTVPVTVQPAVPHVEVHESPEAEHPPMPTEWEFIREDEYPYRVSGLRVIR